MKKFLTFSLVLLSYAASAQNMDGPDIQKMINDKSFVFVATASFGGQPETGSFWQNVYAVDPLSALDKNASIGTFLNIISYPDPKTYRPSVKNSKTEEYPVVYVQEENALFHPSIFPPAFNELIGRNPDSLNNPLIIENYAFKKNKKGKVFVNFNVHIDNFDKKKVKLIILPNGEAEMTIASVIRERYPQFYKGYIRESSSLN